MTDPRHKAARLLGAIDWQTEVSGFCRCPGESLHTSSNGRKDCRVSIDGAPTLHCFHSTCAPIVAGMNYKLRCELGQSSWSLILPGGRVIRSGDVLQSTGAILTREIIAVRAKAEGRTKDDQLLLESVKVEFERIQPELFETLKWTFDDILRDSPVKDVAYREAEDQFRTWLQIWPPHAHVWIGSIYDSGREEHAKNFRPISEWYQIGPVMGNFTCGSSFKAGSYQRSNANCNGTRFMVVESDTLSKDEVGAVFSYLHRRLKYNIHAVIDTGGKSLHGWFDAPRKPSEERRLKLALTIFGCDPKLFTFSQPVRLPGAMRDGKLQRMIFLNQLKKNANLSL